MRGPNHKWGKLNRGRRFTEEERARIGKVVEAFRPLLIREHRSLPGWILNRFWNESEERLLIELMWAAAEFDPSRGVPIEGLMVFRLKRRRQTIVKDFHRKLEREEMCVGVPPVFARTRDPDRRMEDREEVERVLAREAAACANPTHRGRPSRMGPVLAERYMMGMTLEEIAQRRGVTKEAVRLAVERAVVAVRG